MSPRLWLLAALAIAGLTPRGFAQVELANLREDVRDLSQRVGALSLKVEQLERENADLRGKAEKNYVTAAQLRDAVADLNRAVNSAVASSRSETLQQVGAQMEKLAKQTNAALDSLAKAQATRPAITTTFKDDFPKEGISYTVQKGDSLPLIAKKTGAKVADIINANKIADASKIMAGQTLFIPTAPAAAIAK